MEYYNYEGPKRIRILTGIEAALGAILAIGTPGYAFLNEQINPYRNNPEIKACKNLESCMAGANGKNPILRDYFENQIQRVKCTQGYKDYQEWRDHSVTFDDPTTGILIVAGLFLLGAAFASRNNDGSIKLLQPYEENENLLPDLYWGDEILKKDRRECGEYGRRVRLLKDGSLTYNNSKVISYIDE